MPSVPFETKIGPWVLSPLAEHAHNMINTLLLSQSLGQGVGKSGDGKGDGSSGEGWDDRGGVVGCTNNGAKLKTELMKV